MTAQTIIKGRFYTDNFVTTSRAVPQNRALSFEARGMLWYLLSLPGDWKINVSDLQQEGCGRDKAYRIIDELVKHGYIRAPKRTKKTGGKFSWTPYEVYEVPSDNPDYGQPSTENPLPENPYTENQDSLQNKDNKTKDSRDKPAEGDKGKKSSARGEFTKSKFYPVDHAKKIIYTKSYTDVEADEKRTAMLQRGITFVRGDHLNTDTQYETFTRQKPPAKRDPLFDAFAECAFSMKPGFDPAVLNGDGKKGGRVGKLITVLAENEGITFNAANADRSLAQRVRDCYQAWIDHPKKKKLDKPRDPVAFISWWNEWQNPDAAAQADQDDNDPLAGITTLY